MRIAFLGDIALVGQFDKNINTDVEKKIAYLRDMLGEYDYVIGNLESPLTNKTSSMVCKSMHLRTDTKNVSTLKELGVNAVTLANNHILDFGDRGLEDTINALEREGIDWYGVNGKTLFLNREERINLSGYCCYSTHGVGYAKDGKKGINTLTLESAIKQAEKDKQSGNVSVFSIHWGLEHTNYPAYEHIELAKKIMSKNQVVIHGHHPHAIQGIQQSDNGSVVAYSLGNAIFDTTTSLNNKFRVEMNEQNRRSYILEIEIIDGRITNYSYKGFYIGEQGIRAIDITEEVESISGVIDSISDVDAYQQMRLDQYHKIIQMKFGKHDFKWLASRLNYYSVGAKIASKSITKKYEKEKEKFLE
ncbi:MAG: CapA family protein [Lachnospiraceae bacterium]|nr:CapA family protein [Lachnospiraceae bacterium]